MDLVVLGAEKFWILDPLYKALGTLLAWFYSVIPSYGVAIMLLTLTVRILTLPLTAKQARSQQQMQQLQPELKRLQAKYKNDKQKLQEEVMKFYRENHANPLGGCLPVLLQAPILIVLYRLILGLSDDQGPKHVPSSSALFEALRESGGTMVSWGMDLAKSAAAVSGVDKLPFLLLVGLVVATGYYQQRQLTSRVSRENINPQMAMMTKIFPVMFGLISFSIPAGVVVYFLVSNIWQIGQQAVLFRNQPAVAEGSGKSAPGEGKAKGPSAPKAKGGAPPKGRGAAPGGKSGKAGKGAPARGAKGKSAPAKGAPGKGAPAKGAGGKAPVRGGGVKGGAKGAAAARGPGGKSRMPPPRDDRGKGGSKGGAPPGAKSSSGGGAAMGALGARAGGPRPSTPKPAPTPSGPPGGGAPAAGGGGGGKRRRRGRRGVNGSGAPPRPAMGGDGAGNGTTGSGGADSLRVDGSTGGDGAGPDEATPTVAPGDEGQKGNDSWSG